MSGLITILDGGMGRELLRRGAPFRQPEWSALALMEAPAVVGQVHDAFIDAGAEVITTNSYALVPFHIGSETFASRGLELARLAGRLARASADKSPGPARVAGSLPPLFGSYQPELFDEIQAPAIIGPLVEGLSPYVDLWLAETLSSVAEVRVVADALQGDARPRWFSFTLEEDGSGAGGERRVRLRSGESIEQAVEAAMEAGASALLFNCSQAEVMEAAIGRARAVLDAGRLSLRLGVYANSFVPQEKEQVANEGLSTLRDDLDTAAYLAFGESWKKAGADIIGGCCGIGPEHIQALARALGGDRPSRSSEY
ncbi:homocysteine S-methyltransferase family protein [Zobellella iuensis]|uniref:Homocysteine S-methyltransferase family protein n=1 Tax=Zobellella iuensis TaxID=2803811 RepID=A0ABS1QP74_9GAMM|nr:homocysteine S-methyltransferase family protein [Zobellella iuensis]MBL1376322.1 homocysteine S-methyltransferase family protein [Zobellella iuensis]